MTLKRRAFLQRLAGALAALGISESGLALMTDRYQQALAQPTRRKLALLIGINQYPESVCDCSPAHGAALNGCLTDVELQQELLTYRFGFQPNDILVLTDQAATRQSIEDAFMSHLVNQAQPGDVVVVHMSGLGSQVHLSNENRVVSSVVPVDGLLPSAEAPVIHDLLEDTLRLLLQAVPTEQVATVLDLGFMPVGRTVHGNLRIRSRPNAPSGQISVAELAVQERLRSQMARLPQVQHLPDSFPGLVLSATSGNHIAVEGQWNGFSAGLFTYALTQRLWSTTPATTLRVAFNQAIGTVKQIAGLDQQPALGGQKAQRQGLTSSYFSPMAMPNADGVIRSVEDDKVQLWLGGVPATVLDNYGASLLTPVASEGVAVPPLLQVRSREGLIGKARLLSGEGSSLMAGQLVREVVRVLPRNVGLTVALDASLERIERVDAISAFAPIARVTPVIAGDQPADVLFGRALPAQTLTASLSPQTLVSAVPTAAETPEPAPQPGSYGLFSLGRDAIPNTLIPEAEAVKTAVNRVTPQLKTLLALKLLRLTVNSGSSSLGVRATLEMLAPEERLILQQETSRAPGKPPMNKVTSLLIEEAVSTLPVGSQLQYRLLNYSNQPIYFLILWLDSSGSVFAIQPPDASSPAPDNNALIAPGDTVIMPSVSAADWLVQGPPGLAETYLVFSRRPFEQTEQALQAERPSTEVHRMIAVLNPLDVVQALLQDLHQASSSSLLPSEVPADSYRLDVNDWATLSFVYQVVAA